MKRRRRSHRKRNRQRLASHRRRLQRPSGINAGRPRGGHARFVVERIEPRSFPNSIFGQGRSIGRTPARFRNQFFLIRTGRGGAIDPRPFP